MKHAMAKSPVDVLDRIATIEEDIVSLKLCVLKRFAPTGKKIFKRKASLKVST
jgi:hypothetical protein